MERSQAWVGAGVQAREERDEKAGEGEQRLQGLRQTHLWDTLPGTFLES